MMMFRKMILALFLTLAAPHVCAAADEGDAAGQAFADLASLVGEWKIVGSDRDFRIVFETTAGGTVLVETWMRGTAKHSMTLYHRDGDRLIATHYCPQGNQPRLEMAPDSGGHVYRFAYFDATNLPSLDRSHQHSLALDISSKAGLLKRSESYLADGEESFDSLTLEKIR